MTKREIREIGRSRASRHPLLTGAQREAWKAVGTVSRRDQPWPAVHKDHGPQFYHHSWTHLQPQWAGKKVLPQRLRWGSRSHPDLDSRLWARKQGALSSSPLVSRSWEVMHLCCSNPLKLQEVVSAVKTKQPRFREQAGIAWSHQDSVERLARGVDQRPRPREWLGTCRERREEDH